jgi:hypothetical protein
MFLVTSRHFYRTFRERKPIMQKRLVRLHLGIPVLLALLLLLSFVGPVQAAPLAPQASSSTGSINSAFIQASQAYGVPVSLLQGLCYMEGHLSNHAGYPSVDDGYGCMHLVKNSNGDTLDQAAKELGVSAHQLQIDISTNIRGGAIILRDKALQLSHTHQLPRTLGGWYGAVAAYSMASTRSTALMYADALFQLLNQGYSAAAEDGETITLAPQKVQPDTATANAITGPSTFNLPVGCKPGGNVDYPGAINCILHPANKFDCNKVPPNAPCTYDGANRPYSCQIPHAHECTISMVVIHDIEGTAQDALNVFQNPSSYVSVHYIVGTDGTVYQVVREKDVAFHAGNFWYNEHSVGIEHAGFDATGFQWYNATEYLASAKLVAYLLKKYHIPLDHAHIVAHGTTPAPFLSASPNHVDPGPYWLWDYYFGLIHDQGIPYPKGNYHTGIVVLHPKTDQRPYGRNGTETPANFNFFYLYQGPSTASGLIPQEGDGTDITDVTDNVEPDMSYYYLSKVKDPAGTGDTMYEIWYGEEDRAHDKNPSLFAHAKEAWLAVPPGDAFEGQGTVVELTGKSGNFAPVYGRPTTSKLYRIGNAPNGAQFVSAYTVMEDGANRLWYEINYNHRQAWVPAYEVTVML